MRHSNQTGRERRLPGTAAGVVALAIAFLIVTACGSAAVPSGSPTTAPTPVITPDPHLRESVTADQIFRAFGSAKLGIVGNNANAGGGNPDIVKLINADIGSWPLRIIEYKSSAALRDALAWKPGDPPGGDEPPYAFVGLNVLIQYGPISARSPSAPDSVRQHAAAAIAAVLDPLLWPLLQRSVVPIATRTVPPSVTPAPSVKPSAKPPAKTPKPTKKP